MKHKKTFLKLLNHSVFVYALLFSMLVLTSCVSVKEQEVKVNVSEVSPVLVIPPVSFNSKLKTIKKKIGYYLFSDIASTQGFEAAYSAKLKQLDELANDENLYQNGVFSNREIAACGILVSCNTVLVSELLEVKPYHPQRMQVKVLLVNVEDGDTLDTFTITLDLANQKTKELYAEFLDINFMNKIKGDKLAETEKLHTAMMNSDLFQRFVVNHIKKRLFMKNK